MVTVESFASLQRKVNHCCLVAPRGSSSVGPSITRYHAGGGIISVHGHKFQLTTDTGWGRGTQTRTSLSESNIERNRIPPINVSVVL
jgi:hypothetical protein